MLLRCEGPEPRMSQSGSNWPLRHVRVESVPPPTSDIDWRDGLPRSTNVRAASMYQASEVERLLRAIMGIRAHPRLDAAKDLEGPSGHPAVLPASSILRN